jgi:hypothetical protein
MDVHPSSGEYAESRGLRGNVWKLSWSAIWTGVLVALGLFVLMMLFGTALGLSTVDPYKITLHENSYALPAATIAWIVVSAIGSIFVGAWAAGYMSYANSEESLVHGALIWALATLLVSFGLGSFNYAMPATAFEAQETGGAAFDYSSLNDKEFSSFVLERVHNWAPGNPEQQPVNVSADASKRVDVNDIPDDDELRRFVQANSRLNETQAEQFLESEKNAIANAKADAQVRWERAHAADLLRADRARKTASAIAWTLTAIAFLSLAAALGGSYLGWWQRKDRGLTPAEPPPSTGSTNPPPPAETNPPRIRVD